MKEKMINNKIKIAKLVFNFETNRLEISEEYIIFDSGERVKYLPYQLDVVNLKDEMDDEDVTIDEDVEHILTIFYVPANVNNIQEEAKNYWYSLGIEYEDLNIEGSFEDLNVTLLRK